MSTSEALPESLLGPTESIGPSDDNETSVDRIVTAALSEFARFGFEAVTMQQIARAAGVSTKLVYHYFGRKETLYFEALFLMARRFFEKFEYPPFESGDPVSAIRQFALRYADFYLANPQTGRLILDQVVRGGQQIRRSHSLERRREDDLLEPLRQVLGAGVARGEFRPDLSAEGLFFHALIVTIGYSTMSSLLGPLHLGIPDLENAANTRDVVADAIVAFVRSVPA